MNIVVRSSLSLRDKRLVTKVHTCDTISPTELKPHTVTIMVISTNTMRAADSINIVMILRSGNCCSSPNIRMSMQRCWKRRVTIIEVVGVLRNTEVPNWNGKRILRNPWFSGGENNPTVNPILAPERRLILTNKSIL